MCRSLVLLTDFGLRDGFVGVLHQVAHAIAPDAPIIDLSHYVPPQDITAAALLLQAHWEQFPPGSVFVAVVDPGVGTSRRVLAAWSAHRFVVAPDNGLIDLVMRRYGGVVVHCRRPDVERFERSRTFHGRDVFVPLGAFLWQQQDLTVLGLPIQDWQRLSWQIVPVHPPVYLEGRIIHIDHFGNAMTNLLWPQPAVPTGWIEIQGQRIAFQPSYGAVKAGQTLALVNSEGLIEIAVNQGSAAATLDLRVGDRIRGFVTI